MIHSCLVCVICAFEFVIIPEDLEVVKRQHVPKPVRRKDNYLHNYSIFTSPFAHVGMFSD